MNDDELKVDPTGALVLRTNVVLNMGWTLEQIEQALAITTISEERQYAVRRCWHRNNQFRHITAREIKDHVQYIPNRITNAIWDYLHQLGAVDNTFELTRDTIPLPDGWQETLIWRIEVTREMWRLRHQTERLLQLAASQYLLDPTEMFK